jgi:hypothetical protein
MRTESTTYNTTNESDSDDILEGVSYSDYETDDGTDYETDDYGTDYDSSDESAYKTIYNYEFKKHKLDFKINKLGAVTDIDDKVFNKDGKSISFRKNNKRVARVDLNYLLYYAFQLDKDLANGYKQIPDYSKYIINDEGKIKNTYTGKFITPSKNKYPRAALVPDIDGKNKNPSIHRLVALTLLPNPENKPHVDHMDQTTTNYHVDNLRWYTVKENNNNQRRRRLNIGTSRPVIVIDKNGVEEEFPSIMAIEKKYGFANPNICKCLKGKQLTCGDGYTFKYKPEVIIPGEVWRPVPASLVGENKWKISNMGRFENQGGKISRGGITNNEYRVNINKKKHGCAKLVLTTFDGTSNNPCETLVFHYNRNPLDNRLDNLQWVLGTTMAARNSGSCVIKYDLNKVQIKKYESLISASKDLDFKLSDYSLRKKFKDNNNEFTHNGYIWKRG